MSLAHIINNNKFVQESAVESINFSSSSLLNKFNKQLVNLKQGGEILAERIKSSAAEAETIVTAAIKDNVTIPPEILNKIELLKERYEAQMKELEKKLEGLYEEKKAQLIKEVQLKFEKKFLELLDNELYSALEDQLIDEEMPQFLINLLRYSLQSAWPDIRLEIFHLYQSIVLKYEEINGGTAPTWASPYKKCRSFILYTMCPYDKSYWQKTRSFSYWLITIISLVPVYGVQVIMYFIFFCLYDKTDEYQLINYIAQFKGAQFITIGVISAFIGAFQYIVCVNFQSTHLIDNVYTNSCYSSGPAALPAYYIDIGLFIFQILFVWCAFIIYLPKSSKKGIRQLETNSSLQNNHLPINENHNAKQRVLKKLFVYDVIIFLLLLSLAIISLFIRKYNVLNSADFSTWEWQFRADLFWLKTAYGLLSFPFLALIFPLINRIIMHLKATGYNCAGECVPMAVNKKKLNAQHYNHPKINQILPVHEVTSIHIDN
jgi:hypothetical protein